MRRSPVSRLRSLYTGQFHPRTNPHLTLMQITINHTHTHTPKQKRQLLRSPMPNISYYFAFESEKSFLKKANGKSLFLKKKKQQKEEKERGRKERY